MEFAFGKPGLIAISIFQFVFAFGGMAAYCVIIGKLCMREDGGNKTLFY
jgi:sodium-coupled neutral amino acid transporter 11